MPLRASVRINQIYKTNIAARYLKLGVNKSQQADDSDYLVCKLRFKQQRCPTTQIQITSFAVTATAVPTAAVIAVIV